MQLYSRLLGDRSASQPAEHAQLEACEKVSGEVLLRAQERKREIEDRV